MSLRRSAWAAGLRYRVDARPVREFRRRADLVFATARVAVFIDGCFWHGCSTHKKPGRLHMWWREKITRNRSRDRETDRILTKAGWAVVRFWEHEIAQDTAACVAQLVKTVRTRRRSGPG
jgi:DNA mismatch endonuclease (patch repair protein)